MTTETVEVSATAQMVRWLTVNAENVIRYGGLVFILVAGFSGAFNHMHDWSARYEERGWMCWANAITSELLPAISFLSWRDREEQGKPAALPLWTFILSAIVSLSAQLSSTGRKFPYEHEFLAILPMAAAFVILKIVVTDLKFAKKSRLEAEADTARRAELARNQERAAAELAAELARNQARQDAELAAELARNQARDAAELAREAAERDAAERLRLAEVEQAGITHREQLAAAERAEVRRLDSDRAQRREAAEAAAFAAAERIRAEADAERVRAEAARIAAEAQAKSQAAALLAAQVGEHEADHRAAGNGPVRLLPRRRPRAETEAIAAAALSALPAGTSRDRAVQAVARAIGNTERYAREFVPAAWPGASSALPAEVGPASSAGGEIDGEPFAA